MSLPEPIFGWPLVINIQGGYESGSESGQSSKTVIFPISFTNAPVGLCAQSSAAGYMGSSPNKTTITMAFYGKAGYWIAVGI